MPYGKDKIKLTVAVDELTNSKIEKFAEMLELSKNELINAMIKNEIYNYSAIWNIISDPKKYEELMFIYKKKGKDTSELVKLKKKIQRSPRLLEEANRFFKQMDIKK